MEYALVVLWWLAYVVLALLGAPLAARLFPRFAGRGIGFALPLALVVLTTVVYWVGQVALGPAIVVGVVVLVGLAAVAGLDLAGLPDGRFDPAPDLDLDLDYAPLVVFTVGYLFVVLLRGVDPAVDPYAGEKFLDFGLLQALDRAPALPPEDPWFAGAGVSYYYGGHLVAHVLSELTATPPRFAYNLALAGFYGTLVAAAYDLAGAIGAARGGSRLRSGLFAAFAVGLASNLVTAGRFVLWLLPEPLRTEVARAVAARTAELTTAQVLAGLDTFSYWTASRVIPGTINEFPLFGWLNGDLHAHMMGPTFLLLGAALAFAYYRTPDRERGRRRLLVFGAVPLLGGFQAVVNTWSFPTIFGLLWLAVVFAPADPLTLLPTGVATRVRDLAGLGRRDLVSDGGVEAARSRVELTRVGSALVVAGVAGLLGFLLAAPFLLSATGGGERALGVWPAGDRSAIAPLLLVHGAFVAGFLAFLVGRLDPERPGVLALGLVALLAVGLLASFPAVGVVGPVLLLGWVALRFRTDAGFETVLMVGGTGLVLVVEVLYLQELAGPGRMNTVFKTYSQVWALWGVALGVVLGHFAAPLSSLRARVTGTGAEASADAGSGDEGRAAPDGGGSTPALDRRTLRQVASVGFVVLLVASTSLYGVLAVGSHLGGGGDTTLDATAFVDERHPAEATAIRWLDREAEGTPTMLSAPATYSAPAGGGTAGPGMYRWNASPAASLTGVPTVAGWQHEIGYRGREAYTERVRDVDAIYQGDDATRVRLLAAYDVEYVWVGPGERLRYDEVRSFEDLQGVSVAHESGSVTVYRVDQSALPSGA
jgi:YYY domain-containing protein